MEKDFQEKSLRRKYFISSLGFLVLIFLISVKPAVNNIITDVYFWISFAGVSLVTFFIPSYKFYSSKSFARRIYNITDFLALFVIACCIFQFIFTFGFFKADVSGSSMSPTLREGNVLIVRSNNNVDNFDIVIVEYDSNKNISDVGIDDNELLVKRLIAKSGDSFNITNGVLILNDRAYSENYVIYKKKFNSLNPNLSQFVGKGLTYDATLDRYTVSDGYYFVLGDNRDNSLDSRTFGLVSQEQIIGKVVYRVKSLFDWERVE